MELSLTFPTMCLSISIDSPPTGSQDSVVGTVTSWFSNPGGTRDFLSPMTVQTRFEAHPASYSVGCFLGVKWLGLEIDHEVNHSPPFEC